MGADEPHASEWFRQGSTASLDAIAEAATFGHSIPVPIESLVEEHVPLEKIDWPFEIDALMLWEDCRPSKVLIRKRSANYRRRERMTLAHELGHILIPWHIGYQLEECHQSGEVRGVKHVQDQEEEARSIAGRILMPNRLLYSLANDSPDLQEFFDRLDEFEVSTWATLIRLTQILRPGFVFYGDIKGDGAPFRMKSKGTGNASFANMAAVADATGTFQVNGRQIRWARILGHKDWSRTEDRRTTFQILTEITSELNPEQPSDQITKSVRQIQGKISGGISNGSFSSVQDIYFQATQKARTDVPAEVREHLLWDTFVARIVETRALKLGLL